MHRIDERPQSGGLHPREALALIRERIGDQRANGPFDKVVDLILAINTYRVEQRNKVGRAIQLLNRLPKLMTSVRDWLSGLVIGVT